MTEYDFNNRDERRKMERFYRESVLGLTQTEFAQLLGLRQPNVAAHESGRRFSERISRAYVDVGFCEFLWHLNDEDQELLLWIINGNMLEQLHKNYPNIVPGRATK